MIVSKSGIVSSICIVAVFGGLAWYIDSRPEKPPKEPDPSMLDLAYQRGIVKCVLERTPYGTHGTLVQSQKECDERRAQYVIDKEEAEKESQLKHEAARKLCGDESTMSGMVWENYTNLECRNTHRTYYWDNKKWVETKESVKCIPYWDSPIGIVPVSCYDFLGIQ